METIIKPDKEDILEFLRANDQENRMMKYFKPLAIFNLTLFIRRSRSA
ncbi:MAG: hypothetical protein HRU40_20460 [Saprospiraceae bacterium]|nr:hypothetical protein [Saprospiraceae bacterium]